MATTAPASVSPPGHGKLLPGLVGAGTAPSEPSCLCCQQPLCLETGPWVPAAEGRAQTFLPS